MNNWNTTNVMPEIGKYILAIVEDEARPMVCELNDSYEIAWEELDEREKESYHDKADYNGYRYRVDGMGYWNSHYNWNQVEYWMYIPEFPVK